MEYILLLAAFLLYFFPALIAANRKHQNANPIFIINLFFGWTILFWVICFAWSMSSNTAQAKV